MTIHTNPDIETIKARMKDTWSAGDFGQIAKYIRPEAEKFIARRNIKPDWKVLDVACGTGNTAIPAAKTGANVTGVDIADNLLAQARTYARQEDVSVEFEEGDAEDLPFEDQSFDLVISMFGAMLAPRPERVAAELTRVTKPNGQIALANWTPSGFVGQVMKATAKYVPVPPGVPAFTLWGDEKTVHERLRDQIANLQIAHHVADIKFPLSVPETVAFHRTYFGPIQKAFEAIPQDKRPLLQRDLEELFKKYNKATDDTTHVESEYLEIVATRK